MSASLLMTSDNINSASVTPDAADDHSNADAKAVSAAQSAGRRWARKRTSKKRLRLAIGAAYRAAVFSLGDVDHLARAAATPVNTKSISDVAELAIRLTFANIPSLDHRRTSEYAATLRVLNHLGIHEREVARFLRACPPSACARAVRVLAARGKMRQHSL